MSKRAGLVVLLVVVVSATATGGVGALEGDAPTQVGVETDSTRLNVDLQSDGNASWELVYRIELDDANTTAAFENITQEANENPSTYLGPFRERMERTVAAAENSTGREMRVESVELETHRESQPQVEYGLFVYRFEWVNFATATNGTIEAGDAIEQFFLNDQTSLRMRAPDDYSVGSVTPDPSRTDDSEVVWDGQLDFDPGEPQVVFSQQAQTPTSTAGGTDGTDGTDTDAGGADEGTDPGSGDTGDQVGLLFGVMVVVIGAAVMLFVRQRGSEGDGAQPSSGGDDAGGAVTEDTGSDELPPELLSNEERVLQLLENGGGRMKQQEVAEQLDWTGAKTSQVVGDLREEDKVEAFRLGRENVLTLPDVELEQSGENGT